LFCLISVLSVDLEILNIKIRTWLFLTKVSFYHSVILIYLILVIIIVIIIIIIIIIIVVVVVVIIIKFYFKNNDLHSFLILKQNQTKVI